MGCHTWIYKDIDKLTEEEYKHELVEGYIEQCYKLQTYIDAVDKSEFLNQQVFHIKKLCQKDDYFADFYGCMTDDEIFQHEKQRFEAEHTILNYITNNRINSQKFKKLGLDGCFLTREKSNKLYLYLKNECEEFRVIGYPLVQFTSYSALMRWLYKNKWQFFYWDCEQKEKVYALDKTIKNRIKHLFKKHNNNLLIDFG